MQRKLYGPIVWVFAVFFLFAPAGTVAQPIPKIPAAVESFVGEYCSDCHDPDIKKGELDLASITSASLSDHTAAWEKVVRRLRTRQMPPPEKKRPSEAAYRSILAALESSLDVAFDQNPRPGRTDTMRRLTRTEYQNAIRDLLDLQIDASTYLPKDDAGHGFDNVTVANLSPMLLDRYITAAQKISRLAVGAAAATGGETVRIRADVTQQEHVSGLPPGTRGGALIPHTFPQDGEYEILVRLARDRNEEIEGLREPHELEVLLDGTPLKSFTVAPPKGHKNFELVDQHLKVRLPVTAGRHELGVTFVKNGSSLLETRRQPYQAQFNMHRHPRQSPAIFQVSINGPYSPSGAGRTASRVRIFGDKVSPDSASPERAKQILTRLVRKAYRRPASEVDLRKPMEMFHAASREDGFDAGLEAALSAVLVSPNFLFRVEQDPPNPSGAAYKISDLELASRLSFFLWSSIPDDELLDTAIRGQLHTPAVLEKQVRRMLIDSRSQALALNFAGQWLHLRNLDSFTPDLREYPDFDDNLRQSLRTETEMVFEDVLRHDRSVVDLLQPGHTYLNERLARHYVIPHVYGSRFRRVETPARGGLLRHGSILAVTSYPTRTSPVLRGNWILANLIGTPPPPPPGNVPALKDNTISSNLSVRQRLAEHRANAACASCHNLMDPVGFALENFDAVGRWRILEHGQPVDSSGGFPDGSKVAGVAELEANLQARPDVFVSTLTEKLLIHALGRGIGSHDGPAVRRIVREAEATNYRFSSIIIGVARSAPFTMRSPL